MITLRHASSLQSLTANVTLVLDGLRSKLAEVSYYQKPTITSAKSVRVNKTTALLTIKVLAVFSLGLNSYISHIAQWHYIIIFSSDRLDG